MSGTAFFLFIESNVYPVYEVYESFSAEHREIFVAAAVFIELKIGEAVAV